MRRALRAGAWTVVGFLVAASSAARAESLTVSGVAYGQNFNTLVSSGTGTTPLNTPGSWTFSEAGTNANATYTAGTGSGTAGDTYSFGTASPGPNSSDRALGTLLSGTLVSTIGVSFKNDIADSIITSLAIEYAGEEWRLGNSRTLATGDRLDFQYSLDATALNNGTWINFNALDFSTPSVTVVGPKDGNLSSNRTIIQSSIIGLNIAPGSTFWLRWTDLDASGSDDGLAVDDFFLTPTAEPAPVPLPLAAAGGVVLFPFVILGNARRRHRCG